VFDRLRCGGAMMDAPSLLPLGDLNTRRLLAVAVIKFADICNVVRPFAIARRWGFHLVCEFFAQSDWETALLDAEGSCLHTHRSPIMHRTSDLREMAASQRGFISAVAAPLYDVLARAVGSMRFAADALSVNAAAWSEWDPDSDSVLCDGAFVSLTRPL
jgi:3'5'-cyclic nucleotide phosphodiesterase